VLDPGESCDDGNTAPRDGCNGLCQVEANWDCSAGHCTKLTISVCGDGRVTHGEVCDDANQDDGDGCSADCVHIEVGWYCPVSGMACKPTRNLPGVLDAGATCGDSGACSPECGNGVVEGEEECDDGLDRNAPAFNDDWRYNGCTTACRLGPRCGDGTVNGDEECDLGSDNGSDLSQYGCALACTRPSFCGDGIPDGELGEECDLGELNGEPKAGCDESCRNVSTPSPCLYCL
jgi:cysteine-rich repeat protein